MNDEAPWTWDQFVSKLKIMSKFRPDFDLAKHFKELHLCAQRRDSIRDELKQQRNELESKKPSIKKTIKGLNKTLRQLEKNPLPDHHLIMATKDAIEKHSAVSWQVFIPQRYSKPNMYISRLCGIFYAGTDEMPVIKLNEKNAPYNSGEYMRYKGNFYDFLLEAKPLLKEIGIELPKYETLGTCAWNVVKGNKKEKIPSFYESLKEIENELMEIEKIRKELFLNK